jgi:hypothetical protein
LAVERETASALATTHSRDIFSSFLLFSSSNPSRRQSSVAFYRRRPQLSVAGETKQLEGNHDVGAGSIGANGRGEGRIQRRRGGMDPEKSSRRRRASRQPDHFLRWWREKGAEVKANDGARLAAAMAVPLLLVIHLPIQVCGARRAGSGDHEGGEPHRVAEQEPLAAASSIGSPDASREKVPQVELPRMAGDDSLRYPDPDG